MLRRCIVLTKNRNLNWHLWISPSLKSTLLNYLEWRRVILTLLREEFVGLNGAFSLNIAVFPLVWPFLYRRPKANRLFDDMVDSAIKANGVENGIISYFLSLNHHFILYTLYFETNFKILAVDLHADWICKIT